MRSKLALWALVVTTLFGATTIAASAKDGPGATGPRRIG
jgi:hypothetical protein